MKSEALQLQKPFKKDEYKLRVMDENKGLSEVEYTLSKLW